MTGQPAVLWSRKILFLYFVSVIRLTTSFTTLAEIKMLVLAKISSALKNATLLLESFWPFMTKNNPFYYERCYFTHSLKDSSNCFTKRTLCFLFWKFKWKLSWCQAMFDSLTTASVSGQVARYSAKTQFSYVHHHIFYVNSSSYILCQLFIIYSMSTLLWACKMEITHLQIHLSWQIYNCTPYSVYFIVNYISLMLWQIILFPWSTFIKYKYNSIK